ncbi:MAG: pyridoxal kinase PdxY [Spirochaetes bacterium]|nr:pyridoxal kinase PdxY [Spirochaetota bacterium]
MSILSIQSHVAYGYVGNRSAAFPLERLGFDVWIINTVQFSNHTGYGSWKGEVFSGSHIDNVFSGIAERGVLSSCSAVLSGYMGDSSTGDAVLRAVRAVKEANPRALYCCDPVMGDYGRGFFVREGIPEFMRKSAMPQADIITPNQFEAEALSGVRMLDDDDARRAAGALHALGPRIVLVTSYRPKRLEAGQIAMFLSDGLECRVIYTPELPFSPAPNGAGDLASALFLAHFIKTGSPWDAMEFTADGVFSVLERTYADGGRELRLIQSQEEIAFPRKRFESIVVYGA